MEFSRHCRCFAESFCTTAAILALALLTTCNPLADLMPGDSGGVIWKVPIKGWTGAAFDDSLAFFGAFAHEVVAIEKQSGKVRWRSPTNGPLERTSGKNVIVAGRVVVGQDDLLYGFDRKTGARKWVFKPDSGFLPGIFIIDTDGQRIYAGSPSGFAYAVDAETGTQTWATDVTGETNSSVYNPTFDRGVVAVAIRRFSTNPISGGISMLDAATGKVLWRRYFSPQRPGQESGSSVKPAFYGELIIVSADDGRVYALDRSTGTVQWIAPARSDNNALDDLRPLVVCGATVVVGTDRTSITGLDPQTGAMKWDTPVQGGSVSFPYGSDGTTAYTTNGGLYVVAVDCSSGRLKWLTPAFGSPESELYWGSLPSVDADRIYMSGTTGLYAIKK